MIEPRIAYFSMEIGLESTIPTYSGGLGVLAGDTIRAAADLGLPMVAVSLVHRQGYFKQRLDEQGRQHEDPDPWSPEDRLEKTTAQVILTVEDKPVSLRAWRYNVRGVSGAEIPVYLLDASPQENAPEHQKLTDRLYGGDERYRLCQEAVLGIGGVAILDALGHKNIRVYHMNEGHSALLALALLERESNNNGEALEEALDGVRQRCAFTTHTPVPAGHDQFPIDLARRVLGRERTDRLARIGCPLNGVLNLTYVALFFSRHVNGVALRHRQISRDMFPDYPIASITNGVHAATWTAEPFQKVFDRYMPDWRQQNDNLRYAISIPRHEIQMAHAECKSKLLAEVKRRSGVVLAPEKLTLGFARRATPYKRADWLLSDIEQLRRIAQIGPLQIIYSGKAHPHDGGGKDIIQRIFSRSTELKGAADVVYLADYNMDLARLLCSGVDLWVNTPQKPKEASGTSGMKAALNGIPSLSILDGWWIEGHVEDITGWSIGDDWYPETDPVRELKMLYLKLEKIATMFYDRPEAFARVMRYAISLNGAFFNAQRMVEQYARGAYRLWTPIA